MNFHKSTIFLLHRFNNNNYRVLQRGKFLHAQTVFFNKLSVEMVIYYFTITITSSIKYPTKIFLGPKIEISYFLIFPLYFSEFPLYTLGGLRSVASHGKELFPVIFSSSMPQYLQEIEN